MHNDGNYVEKKIFISNCFVILYHNSNYSLFLLSLTSYQIYFWHSINILIKVTSASIKRQRLMVSDLTVQKQIFWSCQQISHKEKFSWQIWHFLFRQKRPHPPPTIQYTFSGNLCRLTWLPNFTQYEESLEVINQVKHN